MQGCTSLQLVNLICTYAAKKEEMGCNELGAAELQSSASLTNASAALAACPQRLSSMMIIAEYSWRTTSMMTQQLHAKVGVAASMPADKCCHNVIMTLTFRGSSIGPSSSHRSHSEACQSRPRSGGIVVILMMDLHISAATISQSHKGNDVSPQ